jgi:hypothetical protein
VSSTLPNGNVAAPTTSEAQQDDDDEDLKKAIELSLKEASASRNPSRTVRTQKKSPEQAKTEVYCNLLISM